MNVLWYHLCSPIFHIPQLPNQLYLADCRCGEYSPSWRGWQRQARFFGCWILGPKERDAPKPFFSPKWLFPCFPKNSVSWIPGKNVGRSKVASIMTTYFGFISFLEAASQRPSPGQVRHLEESHRCSRRRRSLPSLSWVSQSAGKKKAGICGYHTLLLELHSCR